MINLIRTKNEMRIAKEFFLNYSSITDISKKLYPNAFKNKTKSVGAVSTPFSKWQDAGYIEVKTGIRRCISKKGKKFPKKVDIFRLNLNPFFEYIDNLLQYYTENKEKLRIYYGLEKYKLKPLEKEIINYIFNSKFLRELACEEANLFKGIFKLLQKIFLSDVNLGNNFIISFFCTYKKRLKKCKTPEEQFEEFYNIVPKSLNGLIEKFRVISLYSKDTSDIFYNTNIEMYQHLPVSNERFTENDKKEVFKRWKVLYYQKRPLRDAELGKLELTKIPDWILEDEAIEEAIRENERQTEKEYMEQHPEDFIDYEDEEQKD